MSPISIISSKEWQAEQRKDPEFVAAARNLEPGYQIARLRIQLATFAIRHYQPGHPSVAALKPGGLVLRIRYLLARLHDNP